MQDIPVIPSNQMSVFLIHSISDKETIVIVRGEYHRALQILKGDLPRGLRFVGSLRYQTERSVLASNSTPQCARSHGVEWWERFRRLMNARRLISLQA